MKCIGKNQERNVGIDYVKFCACVSVIAVHFRLNIQDKIPINSFGPKTSLFMSIVYQTFIICVPLFLIATGFLMCEKKWSFEYYVNIIKIISLYVLCSLLSYCLVVLFAKNSLTIKEISTNIMMFKQIPYSWYIEMYLGFALLFPIINIFLERVNKSEIQFCILTMIVICSIAPIINSNPKINSSFHLPAYWVNMYPILYYLLGSYIKKFHDPTDFTVKESATLFVSFFSSLLLGILVNYSNANPKAGGAEGYYGSVIVVVQAFSLFLIIMKFFKKKSKIIDFISKHTLSIYLMSYSVDQFVYPRIIQFLNSPKKSLYLFPMIVIVVFVISSLLSGLVNLINNSIWKSSLSKYLISKVELNMTNLIKLLIRENT